MDTKNLIKGLDTFKTSEFASKNIPNGKLTAYIDSNNIKIWCPYTELTDFETEMKNTFDTTNPYLSTLDIVMNLSDLQLAARLDITVDKLDRDKEISYITKKAFEYQRDLAKKNYARYQGVRLVIENKNFDEWIYIDNKRKKFYDRNGYELIFD